ncbi:TetR/AcrR family transcriptional regulator [Mycolicibacterium diernhoferi]|uniref:TetR/AcrR family transcriptional regulator n=1 Tax=Mycolicibacterium diernhoferi TaxID=1801 RepID=A0A1Q4H4Y2_9MYCO|nr:TetR/AcrR family transcriptional regulator [Mycolicibacterium diernhoferi]OJZ62451.1 TetR family transcriptional regulator [Mycolicibacterium diernhoferi]PEG52109.1 TetR/AcrR family transcriptional regulator [Mycolicibacterium diernhoferi]QYL22700.1 TetR/AcrR family transcriptional regulator [Mycolicibacterium diernhoferi]
MDDERSFRSRLLDGLAASIAERGYRTTTVADIVRHAHTSKRTFYSHFPDKEQCFIELLRADHEQLLAAIGTAVDPDADWRAQIRQAVMAYIEHISARPEITLSWIRELPALGAPVRDIQRSAMSGLTDLLVALSDSPGFRRGDISPVRRELAVILLGGLRELTALTVEDSRPAESILEPAVTASEALLGAERP